jgi:hypothetical protein
MFSRAPRYLLLASMALLVTACSGTATGTPASPELSSQAKALAPQENDSEIVSRTVEDALDTAPIVAGPGREAVGRLPYHVHAAQGLAFVISFVGAGEAQGGVPCISCVSGAQTGDNIGLTGPGNYVPSGATWQYTIAYTNLTFTGKCTLAWAITHGATVVDKFSKILPIPKAGGFVLYGLNRLRPKFSGSATLTGRVTCGSLPRQIAIAPLVFE